MRGWNDCLDPLDCLAANQMAFTSVMSHDNNNNNVALVAMMSSVTKKSRLPRTATAAHGLR